MEDRQNRKMNWRFIWGIFMVLFYLGIAVLLFFFDLFNIKESLKIVIALLFFIYGIFRGYRMWKNYV